MSLSVRIWYFPVFVDCCMPVYLVYIILYELDPTMLWPPLRVRFLYGTQ